MFEDFLKKGSVRKASKDEGLIKSLIKTAKNDLKFFGKLEINEDSSRRLVGIFYDVLRSLLESMASIDEYKIYLHEAFTYYLKEIKGEEEISVKFDRFRKIRNSINYYAKEISIDEAKELIGDLKNMINFILNKYLGDYND